MPLSSLVLFEFVIRPRIKVQVAYYLSCGLIHISLVNLIGQVDASVVIIITVYGDYLKTRRVS